ncbi:MULTISPECIES: MATE family efflux transporter [Gordonibacter]|uniref:Multidrug export protein MepA n=1 Tax=Gordonibacter faecis TaxID=3047475 RepID=A0ABT7DL84_9ACTN|nr:MULTISPECIES: MATE family efflux transporter [unclassified Gordonibacter]MDJ1650291.1 MATE family efflux transporter [Gordonibacter sp. KGMB12511]HIW76864.1 MATE family efflux transporter [Candidatus Gordonibacter avicola]
MAASAAAKAKLPLNLNEDSTGAPLGKDPKNPARDNKVSRMGTASIPLLITEFAIPAILGMIVNGAYNVVDSIFLGQAMGEIGLSAATVANPIMIVFMAISMLIGNGGNALAALRLGEGRRVDAEVSLGNTMFLSIVVSVLVALAAANPVILDSLLTLSSATDDVRPYAHVFLQIVCFGFIFQCIGMGVNNFIRTAGAPNRALVTMLIGLVVATIFNYLFVIQLGWGVAGSALATIIGQASSCVAVLWYFIFTKNVPLKLHLRYMAPHLKVLGTIVSLGFASFAVQAGMAIVNFVINHLLVQYGALSPVGADDALASIGVVQRVAMFTVLPLVGVAVAIQPLLGFNYGAKLIDRVRKTLWYGIAGATVLGTVMWGIVHLFPEAIVGAFGITHEGLVDFTVFALKVQLFMLPIVGFQIVGSNYFQATGQPLKSIILSLTRQIIFLVPLLFALPEVLPHVMSQFTGLDALYFATPLADFLSIFTTAIFIAVEMRRLKKLERGEIKAKF